MKRLLLLLLPSLAAAEVQLDDAAKAIADAAAKLDLKHAKFGETLTLDTIAPLDAAKPLDTRALRTNLARLKLKLIDDRTAGNATVITVEAANGARARITVDQGGGAILLTARPANPTLPGRCVAIPDVRHPVNVTSGIGRSETLFDIRTSRTYDVDGDGLADAFVPVAKTKHACPEDVSFRVFVVRGACGHDLGVVGPGSFQFDTDTAAIEASGFRPLTAQAQKAGRGKRAAEMTTTTRRFTVKRGKYARTGVETKTEVCNHCAPWSCSAP